MKSKFDYHVSLADALRSKDLRHLRDFSICILDMEDEEVDQLELEPLVAKIVGRFHEDVFAAATYDLLMTDIDFEEFFIGMIEDGPTRIPKDDRETIETLKQIPFVDVREIPCGRGHAVFAAMADEVRDAIKADHRRYEDLRCLKDDLNFYANSAAVLYGVVSIAEICELYRRWNPETRVTEKIARLVLDFTQIYEESEFFLCEDKVCNLEFNTDEGKDEIIADFIAERDTRPRWYPKSEEDFMDFCEESALLETDEAHALDEFLEKHGVPDLQERTDLLYEIIEKHQFEERISSIISFVAESCKLKDKDAGNGLIGVLVPFLNTTHLRILNGWTPDELHESFITPAVSTKPPVGRNDPCPCGSGLKYKKCCGKNGRAAAGGGRCPARHGCASSFVRL